jgi:restriction system protein
MARRSGFTGIVTAIARDAARAQRAAEAARRRAAREAAQREREMKKQQAQAEREVREKHFEARLQEVEGLNSDLTEAIQELSRVLEHTLDVDDSISFESLRITKEFPRFQPRPELQTPSKKPVRESFVDKVIRPSGLKALVPGAKKKYESELKNAEEEYRVELERWNAAEKERISKLKALGKYYEDKKAAFELKKGQRNVEVAEFEEAYKLGDPEAIVSYNNMVLERSEYPDGFPQEFRLAYTPESKQLVVEYELPTVEVVPAVSEYRYVKAKDEITEKPRKQGEIKELYQDIVAAVALRTIHEVLEADQGEHLEVVCFNGFIQTVDSATGKDIRPHLISVRTTRERFDEIDLARIDKRACLRNLGAQVSPRPAEAQPVKPVVEFDMVDRRFVDQSDVLTDLESRPNLMELNPFEFEHLVANLFEQMGLEAKLTRSSKDGGVDCVAFDPRPVFGGKVVIQAKRYRHTVGVSAVRDLYGTMMNEGANKGILVTTSGYGPDAFDFSKDKPIELIDGGGLLYLLQEVGIEARIIFPEE